MTRGKTLELSYIKIKAKWSDLYFKLFHLLPSTTEVGKMSQSISPDTTLYVSDTTPSNSPIPTATPPHHPSPPNSPTPNSASLEMQIQEVQDTSCSEGSVTQNLGKRKREEDEEDEPYFSPQRDDLQTECRIAYGDYCHCGNDAAHEAWMAVVHYDDRWVHLEKVKGRILRKLKQKEDLFHAHLRGAEEDAGEDEDEDED